MKKARIFLGAIAVFAVVGGALAFKAKTYGQFFCTRLIANGKGVCQASLTGKVDTQRGISYYYTTTDNQAACDQVDCTTTTSLSTIE